MVDINRRDILLSSTAATVAAATPQWEAFAADTVEVKIDTSKLTPEQKKMLGIRFDKLDDESYEDFISGFRAFQSRITGSPAITRSTEDFLKSKGTSMLEETDKSYEECFNLMLEHPAYAADTRLQSTAQHLMWRRARRAFHGDHDKFMTLMEDSDKAGPGKVELNPNLQYPEYVRHEIHAQPGGYVGDPLGGWVYHYAVTQGFRAGTAFFDENHIEYAMGHAKPVDGVVNRCVDLGCGTGQSTTPLKMRFPEAEVWGVEIGAPLVRYAHYRARKMGLDVNFRHALAEDTKFPDGHFDMVSSTILFHEVSAEAGRKIAAEIYRILRPGGTYTHSDLSRNSSSITAKAGFWKQQRFHTYEPWILEYVDSDFPNVLRSVGFKVDTTPRPIRGRERLIATKPA